MKLKVYYAHPVSMFNSEQEKRDIAILQKMGFEVVNPNTPEHTGKYKTHGMSYFLEVVRSCQVCAFRAFPGGEIGSGVAKEIDVFIAEGWPLIELPTGISRRKLTIEQTKEYLQEAGAR